MERLEKILAAPEDGTHRDAAHFRTEQVKRVNKNRAEGRPNKPAGSNCDQQAIRRPDFQGASPPQPANLTANCFLGPLPARERRKLPGPNGVRPGVYQK